MAGDKEDEEWRPFHGEGVFPWTIPRMALVEAGLCLDELRGAGGPTGSSSQPPHTGQGRVGHGCRRQVLPQDGGEEKNLDGGQMPEVRKP